MWRVDQIGEGTFTLVVSEFRLYESDCEFNYDLLHRQMMRSASLILAKYLLTLRSKSLDSK